MHSQDLNSKIMNLEEYLGYVKQFHPIVKQVDLVIAESEAKLLKSRGAFDPKLEVDYDKKQLPLKILNNGMFGSISAPHVFPWGDVNEGEKITCTGRQYLRHMIRFFNHK